MKLLCKYRMTNTKFSQLTSDINLLMYQDQGG